VISDRKAACTRTPTRGSDEQRGIFIISGSGAVATVLAGNAASKGHAPKRPVSHSCHMGFGGGDDTSPPDQPSGNQREKDRERQSYNPNSAVRFTEFGER
jgi:hypothetical protein